MVHSIFNLTVTAVLLPFANGLEKLAILTIPDDAEKESFALLDERLLNTPAVAVARAHSATADMAELARVGVMQAMSLTHTWDDTLAQKVRDEESKVDQYEDALGTYLVKLSSRELNHADSQSVNTLLHTISDFERISDHSVNLLESAQEMHTKEINFSTDAREELQVLEDAVQDVLNRTTDAFRKDDLHLASKVGVVPSLLFAFVLTGWIGMASKTRMQFYRYKNQEYILAARTLGAKDSRLMFKHIFPNAIGTLITSAVLTIPSVIYSESNMTYLGIVNLDSSNMTSLGTMLSQGTSMLTTYPHIILFPAIYISLLMISFNLFGNGLRDAFNPSLRGTEE